jgi:hypothetical protein
MGNIITAIRDLFNSVDLDDWRFMRGLLYVHVHVETCLVVGDYTSINRFASLIALGYVMIANWECELLSMDLAFKNSA